jgi:hypothetical protein
MDAHDGLAFSHRRSEATKAKTTAAVSEPTHVGKFNAR